MSNNYTLWSLQPENLPLQEEQLLKAMAQFGALAPSTHNTQPWICNLKNNSLIVSPDLSKRLPSADPNNRGLYISLGCFVTNAQCAAARAGKSIAVDLLNGLSHIDVRLTLKPRNSNDKLFALLSDQLNKRVSDKSKYSSQSISSQLIKLLSLQYQNCSVLVTDDKNTIIEAATQYEISAKKLASSKEFRKELARWLRPNFTRSFDGMPGFVAQVPTILSVLGPHVLPHVQLAAFKQVEKDSDKIRHSSAIGIVYSNDSSEATWISVGRIYELAALLASRLGIAMTPMAALVEDSFGAEYLGTLKKNLLPQFFFRLGYSGSKTQLHTPRREIVFS